MSATIPSLTRVEMLQSARWRTGPNRVWMLILLCSVALGVSGYLAYSTIMVGEVAGCGAGQVWDCGHVLNSRWSKFLSWPVSAFAAGLYSVVLGSLLSVQFSGAGKPHRLAWSIITVGAICAGLAAIWFIGLQAFSVGRLCAYCMVAHACGIGLCGAVFWRRPLGTRTTMMLSGVSVILVGSLIGAQLTAAPPESYKIERFDGPPAHDSARDERNPANDQQRDVEVFEPF